MVSGSGWAWFSGCEFLTSCPSRGPKHSPKTLDILLVRHWNDPRSLLGRDPEFVNQLESNMAGNITKGGLFVGKDESFVPSRNAQDDLNEGWSVTKRPYRSAPLDRTVQDDANADSYASCGSCSCFVAGNRVLMADGSSKPVEDIVVGDLVMTNLGPNRIAALERPTLGMSRKIIELRGLGDQCLIISDEHPLWVSRTQDGVASQGWGTFNVNHYLYEKRNSASPELPSAVPLAIDLPEQFAHVSGWVHARPVFHHMAPETQLYNLITENGCGIFVEGFLAFSPCRNGAVQLDAPWQALSVDAAAASFVEQVGTIAA